MFSCGKDSSYKREVINMTLGSICKNTANPWYLRAIPKTPNMKICTEGKNSITSTSWEQKLETGQMSTVMTLGF